MSEDQDSARSRYTRCLHQQYGERNLMILDWGSTLVLVLCFWIGLQQSRGESLGWVTSYGGDLFCPLFLQWCARRLLFPCTRRGMEAATGVVLLGCFAWEFAQLYSLEGTPLAFTAGTYDSFDLLAYTVSVLVGFGLDRVARVGHIP